MEENVTERVDYLAVLIRRKWSLVFTTLIIFLLAIIVALNLPSVYKSTATILIEEQEVSKDFVSTADSFAEQRIQYLNQRIMTTSRLIDIIQRLNLYQEMRDKYPTEEIINRFRSDVTLKPLSIEFSNKRTGTIAFTLSYEGKDPQQVQQVANWLATIFIEENRKEREQKSVDAMAFMENETTKLKSELEKLEAQIAEFKQEHVNELPETLLGNVQSLSSIERNMETANQRLRSLKDREEYLRGQLINANPHLEDEKELTIRKRLGELNMLLVSLSKRFSEVHPDIRKVRAEIADLESQLTAAGPGEKKSPPDNPSYISIASQLAGVRSEIKSVQNEMIKLQETADVYRSRIANTPMVEEPYNALVTARNNTQFKYNEMVRTLMAARMSYGAEKAEIGERFTLIEPPGLPRRPFKPNRPAIMLIGLILGVVNGIGLAAFREFRDDSVREPEELEQLTSFPVFASIPEISIKADVVKKRRKRLTVVVGFLMFVAGAIAAFHFFIMGLNNLSVK